MEPISINLGVLIPEKDAIRRVRDLCRRYGTLFTADEVASGFGRTGRVFVCAPVAKSMEENDGTFYSTTVGTLAASPRRSRPCAASRRTGGSCSPALRR
jgi:hypothetical protein